MHRRYATFLSWFRRRWLRVAAAAVVIAGITAGALAAAMEQERRAVAYLAAAAVVLMSASPLLVAKEREATRKAAEAEAEEAERGRAALAQQRREALLLVEVIGHVRFLAGLIDYVLPSHLERMASTFPEGARPLLVTRVYDEFEGDLLEITAADGIRAYYKRAAAFNRAAAAASAMSLDMVWLARDTIWHAMAIADSLIMKEFPPAVVPRDATRLIDAYVNEWEKTQFLIAMTSMTYWKLQVLRDHEESLELVRDTPEVAGLYGITADPPPEWDEIPDVVKLDPGRRWRQYLRGGTQAVDE